MLYQDTMYSNLCLKLFICFSSFFVQLKNLLCNVITFLVIMRSVQAFFSAPTQAVLHMRPFYFMVWPSLIKNTLSTIHLPAITIFFQMVYGSHISPHLTKEIMSAFTEANLYPCFP